MSDALRRIADAVTDVIEVERVEVLSALGVGVSERWRSVVRSAEVPRTPLPTQGGPSNVQPEV
ncbi:hypothetical protein ACH4VR_21020 [Streptomyces sp. NPDC020883]|uniref:hypothetical protein n=1 Tax=Streptomyces sp. NPDC020883 TaxID=3365099 RepID=UPI00378D3A23